MMTRKKIKNKKIKQKNSRQPELLPLPGNLRRLGETLLDQQLWCWGQDVRRPEGNLLLAYGFTRHRTADVRRSSYILTPSPACQIALWGFGFFYGDIQMGGLFLKRYQFRPKLAAAPQLSSHCINQAEAPATRQPRTPDEATQACFLSAAALHWISQYEQWVQTVAGFDYRQQSVQAWHRKAIVSADEMAAAWQELADYWQSQKKLPINEKLSRL
ncbi:MAG: hypothetical protein AAF485_01025 [Chloroflexota bacterium]